MTTSDRINEAVQRARLLIEKVRPLFANQGPEVQGPALVELVALFVAGHAPQERDALLTLHVDTVRTLVPVIERELFGPAGHPAARDV